MTGILPLISFIALTITASANATTHQRKSVITPNEDGFLGWAARHEKHYTTDEIRKNKYETWIANFKVVESINRANLTWTATIDGPFSDLTAAEFKETVLMRSINVKDIPSHPVPITESNAAGRRKRLSNAQKSADAATEMPESFDWREEGSVVTPVHDQGSVGTCWAFSTVANVEGVWALARDELVDLSEEFLVDCDGTADYDENHADCGVFGGWPYLAYQFIISTGGLPTESTDPYCCGTGDCYPCMQGPIQLCGPPPYYCEPERSLACPSLSRYAQINDWTTISRVEPDIQQSLLDIGPLSALLDATQLQFYESGVWTGKASDDMDDFLGCHSNYLDHAVLLVGFGTASEEEDSLPYWTVKNSWGAAWGENGYFRILRGEGTCGINTAVTSSLIDV